MTFDPASAPLPAPATTLVVVIGASKYPRKSEWTNHVLGRSGVAYVLYFVSGLGIPRSQILDLFESDAPAVKQCEALADFVSAPAHRHARDLILCYIGHGGFDGDRYYLGVRDTANQRELLTSLESGMLARTVRDAFPRRRIYVILDCCFAGSAVSHWQASELAVVMRRMATGLPTRGALVLASASKDAVALAPPKNLYTRFSGAFLATLREGLVGGSAKLSFREIWEHVRARLSEAGDGPGALPELHVPHQEDGDISRFPIFPNPAYRSVGVLAEASEAKQSPSRRQLLTAVAAALTGSVVAVLSRRGSSEPSHDVARATMHVLARMQTYGMALQQFAGEYRQFVGKPDDANIRRWLERGVLHLHEGVQFENLWLCDENGVLLGQTDTLGSAPNRNLGKSYYFRDYYMGTFYAALQHPADCGAYIARVVQSEADDCYKLAIAAPLRARDGSWRGVIVANFATNPTMFGAIQSTDPDAPKIVVVAPQDRSRNDARYWNRYVAVCHEGLQRRGDSVAVVRRELDQLFAYRRETKQLESVAANDQVVLVGDDYRDPVQLDGVWRAAFSPVANTGIVVIAQRRAA